MDYKTEWLDVELWFEQPQGMQFKVTVSGQLESEELLELARMNWDANVNAGCIPKSKRP